VQTDATFCGQCGFNLQAENSSVVASLDETAVASLPNLDLEEIPLPDEMPLSGSNPNGDLEIMPETAVSSPIQSPWDTQEEKENQTTAQVAGLPSGFPEVEIPESTDYVPDSSDTEFAEALPSQTDNMEETLPSESLDLDLLDNSTDFEPIETGRAAEPEVELEIAQNLSASAVGMAGATQLQVQKATLLHLQSNTSIEIPANLDVIHFGKPNGQIPPDIDVSGFPDSEVVSRVHADIRIEGDTYYVEDTGSSNGTYINHAPLQKGNRHRLRSGDRIALGKGDLVTFIFQLS